MSPIIVLIECGAKKLISHDDAVSHNTEYGDLTLKYLLTFVESYIIIRAPSA